MYEINLAYFLFGLVIMMVIRLIDMLKMFNPEFQPLKGYQKVFYLFFGLIFILSVIDGLIFNIGVKTIIPIIFLLIGSGIFISDTFVKPSKNYLCSIGLGIVVGSILVIPFYLFFQNARLNINIPYFGILGISFAFFIGLAAGLSMYFSLNRKYAKGLEELWDGTRVWRIVNNKTFVLILWILMIIETYLQLHDTTLLSIFYQF